MTNAVQVFVNVELPPQGRRLDALASVMGEARVAYRRMIAEVVDRPRRSRELVAMELGGVTKAVAESVAQKLAYALDQDAVAVYYPETGDGVIIGPQATKYGPFDINKFWIPHDWR